VNRARESWIVNRAIVNRVSWFPFLQGCSHRAIVNRVSWFPFLQGCSHRAIVISFWGLLTLAARAVQDLEEPS